MGVLLQCAREGSVRFNELVLGVESEAAQSIDARWYGLPGGQRVQVLQGISGMAAINHQA
jgi:hypothetical protein